MKRNCLIVVMNWVGLLWVEAGQAQSVFGKMPTQDSDPTVVLQLEHHVTAEAEQTFAQMLTDLGYKVHMPGQVTTYGFTSFLPTGVVVPPEATVQLVKEVEEIHKLAPTDLVIRVTIVGPVDGIRDFYLRVLNYSTGELYFSFIMEEGMRHPLPVLVKQVVREMGLRGEGD